MKTLAAILVETARPLELADLEIPQLKPGQVLVELAFSGVCRTQLLEARGYRGSDPFLPHCLGHEGSGTVLDIGEGVQKVGAGDRVIVSWIKGSGADVPGTVYRANGCEVNAGGATTFSQHAVVSENRVTPMSDGMAFQDAAMLGCAVPTGLGAIFNTARPSPGQSIAIFGSGGIGLCAVAGAAIAGCSPVIAIDIIPEKLELARKLGATETIDSSAVDTASEIAGFCTQGLDFAIEASGKPDVMGLALTSVRNQGGTAVVIGNAKFGERITLDPRQLNMGKRLLGTWGGDNWPDRDFPRYQRLLISGQLQLQIMQEDVYSLQSINQALDDLEAGRTARPLIDMSLR